MSKIQVNEIVNHFDTDAPDFPRGLTVSHTGVSTYSGDVNIVGIVTAQQGVVIGTGASVGNPTNNELSLYTNSTERLRITGIGSIGIGTDFPRSIVDIQGAVTFRNGGELNAIKTSDDGKLQIYRNNVGNNQISVTIDDSNGNVGIGSTIPAAQLEVNQSNGHVAAFRTRNIAAGKGDNSYQIFMRDDTHDPNRHSQSYFNEDGYPLWGHNLVGTSMNFASVYAGRTQSDADTPVNYYRHGSHSFAAYSARTDDQNNYRTHAIMRAWDGGDDGDRNAIYFVNSGSDTTTADYDQHQKFGIKADGRGQFGAASYIGRVESDEATPNSVYLGASATGLFIYPNSSLDYNYVRARTTDNTDDVYKVDTGGGVIFKVESSGKVEADGAYATGASDYAEYFEWVDGNPNNEDRRGITVVLDEEKIRPATDSDDTSKIIGVVSGAPSVVGDSAWSEWQLAHLKDAYGSFVTEDEEFLVWNKFGTYIDENGNKVPNPQPNVNDYNMSSDNQVLVSEIEAEKAKGNVPQAAIDQNLRVTKPSRVYNPDYDPNLTYVPRSQRQEWDAIGLLGKLSVRRGQPIGSNWILMKSNFGVDPNDSSIVLDRYLVR